MDITIYSKDRCMQCAMTKKFLNEHHIEYIEHNLTKEPQYRQILQQKGFLGLPVIQTNTETFSGFQMPKLHEIAQNLSKPLNSIRR